MVESKSAIGVLHNRVRREYERVVLNVLGADARKQPSMAALMDPELLVHGWQAHMDDVHSEVAKAKASFQQLFDPYIVHDHPTTWRRHVE